MKMSSNALKPINILHYESIRKDSVIEGFQSFLKEIFKMIGYDANIMMNYDANIIIDKSRSTSFREIATTNNIDIFVCDLLFGSSHFLGLDIIQAIKDECPEIPVFAMSEAQIPHNKTSSIRPTFDLFISKDLRLDDAYKQYIAEEIKRVFNSQLGVTIEYDSDSDVYSDKPELKNQFERLLKKIVFTSHNSRSETCIDYIKLNLLKGGFSGSFVFRMHCIASNKESCIHAVLKVSEVKNAEIEIENYLNYVKWYLPYTWRPEMLAHSIGKDIGLICYAFAYNDDVQFEPLSYHVSKNHVGKVKCAISLIFDAGKQKWYKNSRKISGSINEFYYSKYFSNGRKRPHEEFSKIMENNGGTVVGNNEYRLGGEIYPMPNILCARSLPNDYYEHICHGDLNSNNILISKEDSLIFIDFQDTENGHAFLDFITFELSLRLDYNFNLSLIELTLLEQQIESKIDEESLWGMMALVRRAAFDNCQLEVKTHYYYGLCMCAFKLLRLSGLVEWKKNQLVACLLVNLKKIDSFTK